MLATTKAGISNTAAKDAETVLLLSHLSLCMKMNIPFPTNTGPNML